VATLALTKNIQMTDMYLFRVLENESVMNDALSVVLVHLFDSILESNGDISRWVPVEVFVSAALSAFASLLLGFLVAKLMNYWKTEHLTVHYMVSMLVYAVCECFDVSGILGLFVYGACVQEPEEFAKSVSSLSSIIEAYVYVMLGLLFQKYDWSSLGISVLVLLSCIVGRIVMVFSIGHCLRVLGRHQWTTKTMLFFSMCGIRGAISYALCLSSGTDFMKSTTFVVIVSTTLVFGALQKCLAKLLLQRYINN
tara:strand:+ start:8461 stop:9219 length:759 start_codon:yes stop_codon:yes gene_type:complete